MADEWQREERGGRGERTEERIKKRAEQPAVETHESMDFENRAAWPIKGLAPKKKQAKLSVMRHSGIAEDRTN